MPHSIRLRGPWEYQPQERYRPLPSGQWGATTQDLPRGGAIHLPANWGGVLGTDFSGQVRFTRTFHRPTGLIAQSRIWLVIEEVDWRAVVTLNGRRCGEVICTAAIAPPGCLRCPARLDIAADLLAQNRLEIVVASPVLDDAGLPLGRPGREGQPGGLIGLVRIEIQ